MANSKKTAEDAIKSHAKKEVKRRARRQVKKVTRGIPVFIFILLLVAAACIVLALEIAGIIDLFKEQPTYTVSGGTVEIHMIDIGQGDSILVMAPEGNILFDTGNNDKEIEAQLKAYLDNLGIKEIDYLVLTHHDGDHIGNADMVLETYSVGTVIMEDYYYGSKTSVYRDLEAALEKSESTVIKDPAVGEVMTFGELHLKFLGPVKQFDNKNNDSIVVRLDFGENSILMTGDASKDAEVMLLNTYSAAELDCDVLKVGHHGSNSSSLSSFLKVVTPEYALISCGVDNEYGHPTSKVLARLEDVDAKIYRTDLTDDIVLVFDGTAITVKDP